MITPVWRSRRRVTCDASRHRRYGAYRTAPSTGPPTASPCPVWERAPGQPPRAPRHNLTTSPPHPHPQPPQPLLRPIPSGCLPAALHFFSRPPWLLQSTSHAALELRKLQRSRPVPFPGPRPRGRASYHQVVEPFRFAPLLLPEHLGENAPLDFGRRSSTSTSIAIHSSSSSPSSASFLPISLGWLAGDPSTTALPSPLPKQQPFPRPAPFRFSLYRAESSHHTQLLVQQFQQPGQSRDHLQQCTSTVVYRPPALLGQSPPRRTTRGKRTFSRPLLRPAGTT